MNLRRLAFFGGLLVLWETAARLGVWASYLLPPPSAVARALFAGLLDGSYTLAAAVSLRRILVAYAFSALAGTVLGLLLGRFRALEETVGSLALGLQTLPSVCWLPLALLWFGLSEQAILFVAVMGAVLSITIATEAGVRNLPPIYVRAGRTMGARGLALYRNVILPAAFPYVVSGLKQGWSFAWRSLMAGELLYVNLGLGQLLMMGRELNDLAQVMAVMLLIIGIGVVVDRGVFARIEQRIRLKWGLLA
ncbi:MAG TPA: ABC transporter permease [Firmicutes bacterium]|nr:ABC transporter permease [Bacillota bacterium]